MKPRQQLAYPAGPRDDRAPLLYPLEAQPPVSPNLIQKLKSSIARFLTAIAPLIVRLWRDYLSRYWLRLFLSLFAMAAYALSASAIPIGVEWINAGLMGADEGSRFRPDLKTVVYWGPAIVVLLGAVNALSQYCQTRLSVGAALSALRDMQNDLFASLLAMDFAQQRAINSGQIISRFTNDTTVLRETLTRISNGVRDLMTLLGLCAMMVYYDAFLFLVVLLIYPVIGLPVAHIGSFLRKSSKRAQEQAGDITSLVSESVTGARMVKSYQIEPLERARAADAFDSRLSLLKKMAYARGANEPFIFFAGSIAVAVIVAIVAARISSGALTTSSFVGFLIALLLLSQPARGLGTLVSVVQEGLAAFERITQMIDISPQITSPPNAPALSVPRGEVRFNNVSFSYDDEISVLENIDLTIPAGKTTALVGASGSGKSTLVNLLPRLYAPTQGQIEVDGVDISDVTLRSLRQSMALVAQDAVLFDMSALENIAFGKPTRQPRRYCCGRDIGGGRRFYHRLASNF